MSDEGLEQMESTLQNITSIPPWDKFGLMGKLMGYATRGKPQSYLFIIVWLIVAILSFISLPIWLPMTLYKMWRRRRNSE